MFECVLRKRGKTKNTEDSSPDPYHKRSRSSSSSSSSVSPSHDCRKLDARECTCQWLTMLGDLTDLLTIFLRANPRMWRGKGAIQYRTIERYDSHEKRSRHLETDLGSLEGDIESLNMLTGLEL